MPAVETEIQAFSDPKRYAHALVERMTEEQAGRLAALLETVLEPTHRFSAAYPLEDELISEAEEHDAVQARAAIARGEVTSHEDFLAELGLTPEDIENFEDSASLTSPPASLRAHA